MRCFFVSPTNSSPFAQSAPGLCHIGSSWAEVSSQLACSSADFRPPTTFGAIPAKPAIARNAIEIHLHIIPRGRTLVDKTRLLVREAFRYS